MTLENEEVQIHGNRKWISFDPTLHAGHIMIIVTLLVGGTGAWYSVQARIDKLELENAQRVIDNNYVADIEKQHHAELVAQIFNTQNTLHQEIAEVHADVLTSLKIMREK